MLKNIYEIIHKHVLKGIKGNKINSIFSIKAKVPFMVN